MAKVIELSAADGGLASCLGNAKVDKVVIKYITKAPPDGLGLQSLSDFLNLCKKSSYEDDLERRIIQPLLAKNSITKEAEPLQTSRLRAAWQTGSKAVEVMDPAAGSVSVPEEAELPSGVAATLKSRKARGGHCEEGGLARV